MAEDILVVASKVKDYISSKGGRTSGELIEALSKKVQRKLDRALERAKENSRQTVMPYDI
ncbi:MAG: hypothetical protein LBD62_00390 [Candidatus Margulisbacteria bacterium]|jgi:ribosomal protein S18|nr:hypothetical protein [Candidatus Margulisiibacteriota bacterium]